jgi:hypothetical protein
LIGAQGTSALAAVLKETKITTLKCATTLECSLSCQCPLTLLTAHLRSRARSLSRNKLGPEGVAALAEGLKGDSTLQSLEYAACGSNRLPSVRLPVSAHWHAYSHHPHPTPRSHSLSANSIGDQGASALAAILKETQITNLGCAAA